MMAPTEEEDEDQVLFDVRKFNGRRCGRGRADDDDDDDSDDEAYDRMQLLGSNSVRPNLKKDGTCLKVVQTIILCLSFCGMGLVIALPGPTMLDLQEITGADTEKTMRIFTGRSIGYLLGSIVGGLLFDHLNKFFLIALSLLFSAFATASAPWCENLWLMICMFSIVGFTMGFLDTGGNVLCIGLWGRSSAPFLQALHFAFGMGAFVAPLIAEPFLSSTNSTALVNFTDASADKLHQTGHISNVPNGDSISAAAGSARSRKNEDIAFLLDRSIRSIEKLVNGDNKTSSTRRSSPTNLTSALPPPPPTAQLPKKPDTNGKHLSSEGKVAAGQNIKAAFVKNTLKKLNDKIKNVAPETATQKSTSTSENVTNNATGSGSNATISNPGTTTMKITTVKTTTQTTTTTPTPAVPTTARQTVAKSSATQPTRTGTVTDNPAVRSTISIAATTTKTPLEPGFELTLHNIEEKVVKAVHYFKERISKVKFAYLIVSLFLFVVGVLFCVVCCFDRRRVSSQYHPELHGRAQKATGFKVQLMILLCFFLLCYVGMEVTYGGLVMTFAVDYLRWTKREGSYLTSVFWGSFAATRGLCIFVARYLRPAVMLIIDLCITVVTLLVMLFMVQSYSVSMWIGTAMLGVGMASIFPTGIAWAERYINVTSKVAAWFVMAAALGEMALPVLTGFLFEKKTPMFLVYVPFAASLACCVAYIIMQNLASNHGEKYSLLTHVPVHNDDDDVEDATVFELNDVGKNSSSSSIKLNGTNKTNGQKKNVSFDLTDETAFVSASDEAVDKDEDQPQQNGHATQLIDLHD
ncbi:sodium-dependent glucose transporter 1-like [Tubulanus polymorphus]|uniref:sodium-dependent glucose transporter 1-like n=1 Tax=Tubulanus polymorphus TaxID=672921 RepID=UPI003DA39DC1